MSTGVEKYNGGALAGTNGVDQEAILKSLNLNPRDPKTQALLLVCDRYGLDPLLRHMVLISGNPYVTRDGYLAVAHRSGVFDGMEVLEQTSDTTHHIAKVAVYRKDMRHAFTFVGRFPKSKQMAKDYGPEMAVKVAEVQALRRAFNVTGVPAADERWDVDPSEVQEALPVRVDAGTGEIVGGGDAGRTPPPAAPPANAVRRPPPGRARGEKGDPPAQATSSAGSTASDQAGPVVTTAPPTITPAALDSLRALAARKGLDDADMEKMAGKEFGTIATLTEPESQALTQLIVKFKQTPGEVGLPPETAKADA